MENVIDLTAADKPFSIETAQITAEQQTVEAEGTQISQISEPQSSPQISETQPRERSSADTRGAARAVMIISAVCGAAAGVLLAVTGKADSEVVSALSGRISGSFAEIFLQRALSGGAILLAEFVLGFFAFGDFASWVFPVLAGMGGGFFIAALQKPVFLPSEIAVLIAVIFAGANSAMFSQKLLGLASGKRSYMRGMSASEYAARFALMFLAVVAAAVYEGIAATTFGI